MLQSPALPLSYDFSPIELIVSLPGCTSIVQSKMAYLLQLVGYGYVPDPNRYVHTLATCSHLCMHRGYAVLGESYF